MIPGHRKANSFFLILGALLLLSFGLGLWQTPDRWVFRHFNGVLIDPRGRWFWAFVNTRVFDALAGVVMGLPFLLPGLLFSKRQLPAAILRFLPILLLTEIGRLLLPLLSGPRPSPSLAFRDELLSLLDWYPELQPRVFSETSFPSDHAAILFCWSGFLLLASTKPLRWLAPLYALALAFPRLVGGGHWLSDIAVGGGALACLGLGLGYGGWLGRRAQTLGDRLAGRLGLAPEA